MILTPYQRKKLRDLVELSTVLSESHRSVYERSKSLGNEIREAESQLTSLTRPRPGFAPNTATVEAETTRWNAILTELREKSDNVAEQLKEMDGDVANAGRLAQALLDYTNLDSDLMPVIRGLGMGSLSLSRGAK
jgi:chromosome segregation ATPase